MDQIILKYSRHHDTQHNDTWHNDTGYYGIQHTLHNNKMKMTLDSEYCYAECHLHFMLRYFYCKARCHQAKCHYAECHPAKCCYVVYRGAYCTFK